MLPLSIHKTKNKAWLLIRHGKEPPCIFMLQGHIFNMRKDTGSSVVLSQVVLFSFNRNLVSSQRNTICHFSPLSAAGTQWLELNELLQSTTTTKLSLNVHGKKWSPRSASTKLQIQVKYVELLMLYTSWESRQACIWKGFVVSSQCQYICCFVLLNDARRSWLRT